VVVVVVVVVVVRARCEGFRCEGPGCREKDVELVMLHAAALSRPLVP